MSCINCIDNVNGVCKVCQLVDQDEKVKIVTYCETCGVYICKECTNNLVKRMKAFAIEKLKLLSKFTK